MSARPAPPGPPERTVVEEDARRVLETPCGRVRLLEPSGVAKDLYWRLEYYVDGVRHQTSGGRTLDAARVKADQVLSRLDAGVQREGREFIEMALGRYVAWVEANCSFNHHKTVRRELPKLLEPLRRVRCEDLDRRRACERLNASSTKIVATHHKSRLSAFLTWGQGEGYFTESQTTMLSRYRYVPTGRVVARPSRTTGATVSGEDERYVTPDEVPRHSAVAAAGDALGERLPAYGRLYVELMAVSGDREAEHLALDAPSVHLDRRQIDVKRQVLDRTAAEGPRTGLPKGNKTRTTIFTETTPSGYDLAAELEKRLFEVEREHELGRNPQRLLFPALKGGYHWAGSFTTKVFVPACLAAGWEQLSWEEEVERDGKLVVVARHAMKHTQHSLRHRFARDCIDLLKLTPEELLTIGGWESAQVLWARYYGSSRDVLDRVAAKVAARR